MKAKKLRELGNKLMFKIDAKENSGTSQQRMTPRRARIIASQLADARALRRQQTTLYRLADAHEAGTVNEHLSRINSRTQIETLLFYPTFPYEGREEKQMKRAGITPGNYVAARQALEALAHDPDQKKHQALKEAELAIAGWRIDGYFPTPPAVIKLMLEYAEIESGMKVLEPSAGKGDIADAILAQHPGVTINCYEVVLQLRTILELKEHNLDGYDFLRGDPADYGTYDRVIMNPPFERFQDIEHVRMAYRYLKPGGRLVAVMSEGTFFRKSKIPLSFQAWLIGRSHIHDLPAGAFKSSGTGAKTRLVVIDKEE